MVGDFTADDVETMIAKADAERERTAPSQKLPPDEWARKNLFSSWYNSIITVVVAAVLLTIGWRLYGWVRDQDFAIIRTTLRLFMVGQFPKEELWRLWASLYLVVATIGLTSGAMAHNTYDDAIEKGLPAPRSTWPDLIRRFWAIIAVSVFFVSFARTAPPFIGLAAAYALLFVTRETGWRLPSVVRSRAVFIGSSFGLASMLVIAGTSGLGRWSAGVLAALWAMSELSRRDLPSGLTGRAIRSLVPLASGAIVFFIVDAIGFDGYGWEKWGGLHVSLFVTIIGIGMGLPLGILLATGRRSQLPIIKAVSVLFIESVRGVPLISLLLFSNLMLLNFFPLGSKLPADLTMAMIVIMMFSAAYIAEIVRGGLQSVPQGQIEAAQAAGLSPGAVQRLIVLPQALRNVIPAMVGQFISLFKDTSLLSIIGIADFLRVSDIANAQPEFLGKGLTVITYPFIAIGYWAFAYTMSKESRRLETKLGVGTR